MSPTDLSAGAEVESVRDGNHAKTEAEAEAEVAASAQHISKGQEPRPGCFHAGLDPYGGSLTPLPRHCSSRRAGSCAITADQSRTCSGTSVLASNCRLAALRQWGSATSKERSLPTHCACQKRGWRQCQLESAVPAGPRSGISSTADPAYYLSFSAAFSPHWRTGYTTALIDASSSHLDKSYVSGLMIFACYGV